MRLTLYPYQVESVAQLRAGFMKHQRQILVLPTGGGKTVVFSTIVEAAVKRGTITLVLTDRLELFEQTIRSIASFGIPICKIDKSNKHYPASAKMYVGMVETVKRRISNLQHIPFQLIICDEAHMQNFNRIFDVWPTTKVIGATATPIGKHIHKYYTNLVSCIDTPQLVEQGFLAPCKAFEMQDDFSDVTIQSNGEFQDASLFAHMNKSKLYAGVIDKWLEKCKGQKTIVFNVNVEHTIKMTEAFNAAGIKAYCIHSDTDPVHRAWIMKQFADNAFMVLLNCGILTKGYNEPAITCVILNRATHSLALYLQMIGRGSRTLPGKPFFTVLDFGMNHTRHGLWNEPRAWSIEPPKKRSQKVGAAPVKSCPACSAMLPPTQKECPYCGYLFQPSEKELLEGRLVELTNNIRSAIPGRYVSQLTIPELIECEKVGELKAAYVWRVLRSRGAIAIGEYARIKEYKDAWVIRQLEALDHELNDGKPTVFFDKKINEVPLL